MREQVQEVDTNSSSPHPAAAGAPTPPTVCLWKEKKREEKHVELVECREEEEDLKDLLLGGDKQTETPANSRRLANLITSLSSPCLHLELFKSTVA